MQNFKRLAYKLVFLCGLILVTTQSISASPLLSCPPGQTESIKIDAVTGTAEVQCGGGATSQGTNPRGNNGSENPNANLNSNVGANSKGSPTPAGPRFYWRYCVPFGVVGGMTRILADMLYQEDPESGIVTVIQIVQPSPSCKAAANQPGVKAKPLPCPEIDFALADQSIACSESWLRQARAVVPPVPITYTPYPRGIVTDKIIFSGPAALITQNWNCSQSVNGWDPIAWTGSTEHRNFVFCLRWRQVKHPDPAPDPAPAWFYYDWDERAWGEPKWSLDFKGTQDHTYVTASAQKVENGPSNLPAYQVQVHSYWILDWRSDWEYREFHTICARSGDPKDTCDGKNGWSVERIEEHWHPASDDGTADLRRYGNPNFFLTSRKVRVPDGRAMTVLPVPVIEVQGVIQNR
ncbi:MAG: hypothetical protein HY327_02770 [Chloroflexi bacterium]|nr:hypothetical protein [Chloroflexota bacterium]